MFQLRIILMLVALAATTLVPAGHVLAEVGPDAESSVTDAPEGSLSEESSAEDSGFSRRDALLASLTIFILAVFIGFEVITKVPPTLHTPLMSGSNAISGVTLVGAVLTAGAGMAESPTVAVIGMLAVILATLNVVGGFLVTHRMLAMFQKK